MRPWAEFAIALTLFFAGHVIPTRPGLRARLAAVLGERGFTLAYGLVSTALLAWLIIAAGRAPTVMLWDFAPWRAWVALTVMPWVCLLVALGVGAPNPLSFGGAHAERFDAHHPGVAGAARHPLLWALALWAFAHLLANGDLAHVILFGLFGAFALGGMVMIDGRKRRSMGAAAWAAAARATSAWPLQAWLSGRWRPRPAKAPLGRIALGLGLYGVLLWLHPLVIGVSPLAAALK